MRCWTLLLLPLFAAPAAADTLAEPSGVVTVEAPGNWKEREDKSFWRAMASWDGRLEVAGTPTWAQVFVQRRARFSRAALAIELPYMATDEIVLPGERRVGERFAEVATRPQEDGTDRGWLEWRRGVEANGLVYVVTLLVGSTDVAAVRDAVRPVLDSVAAAKGADGLLPAVRDGWWTREIEGFVVVSDAKQKARAAAVARKAATARRLLAKVLGGEPYVVTTPVIWAFADSVSYETFVTKAGGDARLPAEYVADHGIVAVELAREESDDTVDGVYWDVIRRQAAYQYVCEYFGGATPVWLRLGLSYYAAIGAESGGRGDKPRTWYIDRGRGAAAVARPLGELLPLRFADIAGEIDEVAYELWAWHSFLRHTRSQKPARAAYGAYVSVLRETGSPTAAARTFESLDQDALLAAMRKFSDRWR